jgi:hypothetical protein
VSDSIFRNAGPQRNHASDVGSIHRRGHVSGNQLVNIFWRDTASVKQFLDCEPPKLWSGRTAQLSSRPDERSADSAYNHCFCHDMSPLSSDQNPGRESLNVVPSNFPAAVRAGTIRFAFLVRSTPTCKLCSFFGSGGTPVSLRLLRCTFSQFYPPHFAQKILR